MPILSRRAIQNIIFESLEKIDENNISKIVEILNKENIQSLDALWELIVIFLLSKHGDIGYEIDHGGRSRPDIFFKNEGGLELVADITCISDQGQDKNNDVKYFNDELSSVAKKIGLKDLSGFDIRIENDCKYKDKKIKLKLPEKNNVRSFINSKIKPFLVDISRSERQPRKMEINENGIELIISYDPDSAYFTCGYASFTVAKSLTNNPVYNRLKVKSGQLKDSGYEGLKGVIICDGGCDLITSTMSDISSYGIGAIIENFLNQQNTISFVIVIFVEECMHSMLNHRVAKKFSLKYMAKENCKSEIDKLTRKLIVSAHRLPHPILTSKNASRALKEKRSFPGSTFYGGYSMSDNKITISSRVLLDLISGNISSEQLIKDHNSAGMYLKRKIDQGYQLSSISLNKMEGSDDDWVEFCFCYAFDPSVSSYIVKRPND